MKEGDYFAKVFESKYYFGKIIKLDGSDFFGRKFKVKILVNKGTDAKNGSYGENTMLLSGAFVFVDEQSLIQFVFGNFRDIKWL